MGKSERLKYWSGYVSSVGRFAVFEAHGVKVEILSDFLSSPGAPRQRSKIPRRSHSKAAGSCPLGRQKVRWNRIHFDPNMPL